MRSISSAIISFVIFYIGLCFPKKEIKQHMIRGWHTLFILCNIDSFIYIDDFGTLMKG